MNVVIVGNFWFPRGTASAARIRNLALGLRECGAFVHVITLAPHPRSQGPAGTVASFEGVTYEHAAPTYATVDGPRRLLDRMRFFAGLYAAALRARRLLKQRIDGGKCDLVVAYDRSAIRMAPLVRLCRTRGVPSVLDVTEVSQQLRASRANPIYWDSVAGTRLVPRLFAGLTVITSGLESLYRRMGCANTLVLPAMEEWRAGPGPEPTGNERFHLTYVGALHGRDNPELLIALARLLSEADVPITLDVIGRYEGTDRGRNLARLCAEDPAVGRVVRLVGRTSDEGLIDRLTRSDGLLLTRRLAPTEEYSFPTRLVEHLRFARPVFVSDVGDISRYLIDGREAFLLDPSDPKQAARTIAEVVARPDRGATVGVAGREAGARAFDRKRHAARLLEFAARLTPEMAR